MKRLVVLGAGESGTGAALLGRARGYDVFVSDHGTVADRYRQDLAEAGIAFEAGGHTSERVLAADLVVKSPGIPDGAQLVRALRAQGTPVIDELEFAARHTDARFVAITGSNGKTTTTLLTHHLLTGAGFDAGLAGNVGASLARQVLAGARPWYVLEVSSFQLDGMYDFRAHVAVLLNITPDHLDRYDYDFSQYVASKFRVVQNQTADDHFVAFADDETLRRELPARPVAARPCYVSRAATAGPGAFPDGDALRVRAGAADWRIPRAELPLRGAHNEVNALAALLVCALLGADEGRVRAALSTFRNAPHRLEPAGTVRGVRFVNDSKATNVDAVRYALDSFDAPVVWLAGGVDKGNDYEPLAPLVREKVRAIVSIGKDDTPLQQAFATPGYPFERAETMADAVRVALRLAEPGDVVLLSPACASFDRFRNYEDRGAQFCRAVRNLTENPTPTP